jgi:hypothetical protein
MSTYDASRHPDVITGSKTAQEVLREFLETFEVGGEVDGKVTLDEFLTYYSNVGMSIDDEDYFELMIRNAWRILGGEGQSANTANTRVLVTRADGTQEVVAMQEDVASASTTKPALTTMALLQKQGEDVASFSTSRTASAGSTRTAFSLSAPGPPLPPRVERAVKGGMSTDSPFDLASVAPAPSPAARPAYGHDCHKSSITF